MNSNIILILVIACFTNGVISDDNSSVIINGSTQPNIPSVSTVTPVPTTPPTTSATTTTTTQVPPTNITTTDKTTVTTPITSTNTPNITTTPSHNVTSTTESTTLGPTSAPSHKGRKFDGPSFIGGIILAAGLMAICFVSWKFYKARTERNYHTL